MKTGYNGYAALFLAIALSNIMPADQATETAIRTEKFFAKARQQNDSKSNALRRTAHAALARKATTVRKAA